MTLTTTMLDAALGAVARGWHVLPVANVLTAIDGSLACSCTRGAACTETGKHPLYELVPNGLSNATTDPHVVRHWWGRYPLASIGVVMVPSGLVAFDIDLYKGDGEKLEALQHSLGELPTTQTQKSGSGQGAHTFFKAPGFPVRGEIGGVTMRSRAYVVLAPSTHKSGGRYEWYPGLAPGEVEIAELPPMWKEALRKSVPMGDIGVPSEDTEPEWLRAIPNEKRIVDMRMHLEKEPGEIMGQSRPGMAWDVMRTSARAFAVRDPSAVFAAAVEIYNRKCQPPYPEDKLAERVIGAYEKAHTPAWGAYYLPTTDRLQAQGLGFVLSATKTPDPVPEANRDEIWAALKEAASNRSTKKSKILERERLQRILKKEPLTTHLTDDFDQVLAETIELVLKHVPATASAVRIAEFMQHSSGKYTPDELAEAIEFKRQQLAEQQAAGAFMGDPENDDDLRARLIRGGEDGDQVKTLGSNIEMILRFASDLKGHLRFNELLKTIEVTGGRFRGSHANGLDVAIKNWMETTWGLVTSTQAVNEQILYVSREWFAYDPVAEYLEGLVWDGVPRIDTWIRDYCGADDTAYNRKVSRRWMISAVARALDPGCKVDTVLVLEGVQGAKKSTAFNILGGEWFTDTPLVMGDKDSRMMASARWIVELAELSSITKSEIEAIKAFLSSKVDDFRPPYGRAMESFKRRCVFAGTTNDEEYLEDQTGNRRWWAVRVVRVNTIGLAAVRDQLWAEAVARYRAYLAGVEEISARRARGEAVPESEAAELTLDTRWWFEDDEQVEADLVAADRRRENPWVGLILDWVSRQSITPSGPSGAVRNQWTLADIAAGALDISTQDLQRHSRAIGNALREAGFKQTKPVQVNGTRRRYWTRAGVTPLINPPSQSGSPAVPGPRATVSGVNAVS